MRAAECVQQPEENRAIEETSTLLAFRSLPVLIPSPHTIIHCPAKCETRNCQLTAAREGPRWRR